MSNKERQPIAVFLAFFLAWFLGGCGIWEGPAYPDHSSKRAEQICHPYGNCSQGRWIGPDGSSLNSENAYQDCQGRIDGRSSDFWWEDSVSRGLEANRCMREEGYTLKQ